MLSHYLNTKQAHFDSNSLKLTLSYISEPLTLDPLPLPLSKLRQLVLNHCNLNSLAGIEQFSALEALSIRHNNIEDIGELYRIKSKQKIRRLNFQGNEVEYCSAGLFLNLKKVFPNLQQVNDKDYGMIISHKKMEKHGMKQILRKASKIQKEMAQLVQKEHARNTQITRSMAMTQKENYEESAFKQTKPTKRKLYDRQYQQPYSEQDSEEEGGEDSDESEGGIQTTEKKRSERGNEESALKENKNWNNINHNDISLGGISNIPMTKSIRASAVDKPKKKGLEIFTLNESLQAAHQTLAQPTATFAMQRQRETQNNFVFRNKSKRYETYEMPLEQCQSKYQNERPTKRQTTGSQEEVSWGTDSGYEQNLIGESILQNREKVGSMAEKWSQMQLQAKVFFILKHLPKKRNLPMKLQFE